MQWRQGAVWQERRGEQTSEAAAPSIIPTMPGSGSTLYLSSSAGVLRLFLGVWELRT